VEASGKTVLPGLVDVNVDLAAPGGLYDVAAAYDVAKAFPRAIEAYLYCGVTTVRDTGEGSRALRRQLARFTTGERLGAEVVAARPGAGEIAPDGGRIPDAVFERMKAEGMTYTPMLARAEAAEAAWHRETRLLDRSLVEQVGPAALLAATRRLLTTRRTPPAEGALAAAQDNLRRAWKMGVRLAAGSASGSLLLVHGPALHRELQLWVQAGIPAQVALEAATANGARLLGRGEGSGRLVEGMDASLLVVDGNPLEDIAATERISMVFLRGEQVARAELFEQE
jgi:imidazolonepropionase-like amidohydrolase